MDDPRDEAFQAMFPTPVVWSELPDGNIVVAPEDVEVCDFCSSPDPIWEYSCRDFQYGLVAASLGSWSACEVCSNLIESENWDALRNRAVAGVLVAPDDPAHFAIMEGIHKLFRENRTGERRRYG